MALPTPGVTPANWGAQLNAEIELAYDPPTMFSGAWVTQAGDSTPSFTGAGTIALAPILGLDGMTVDQVGYEPGSAVASATARLGIYLRTGRTTFDLAHTVGSVDTSTAGLKSISYSFTVAPGHYFAVLLEGANAGLMCMKNANGPVTLSGLAAMGSGANAGGHILGVTQGSLPSTVTAPTDDNTRAPRYYLRKA